MGWVANVLVAAFMIAVFAGVLAGAAAVRTWRLAQQAVASAKRIPLRRRVAALPSPPSAPTPSDADLVAYPERLAALEERLVERHGAVQDQLRVLTERRLALGAKPDRADLVARYEADIGHLDKRAASIRRVVTLVWRTRAILLLRVHLAVTGRRRPQLGDLPEGGAEGRLPREQLAAARSRYGAAATAVQFYLDEVQARAAAIDAVVPAAPAAAEADEAVRAVVAQEVARTRAAHEELAARMDRLADNLTWLGDHAGTLEVVDDDVQSPAAGPHGESAAHLLGEVDAAVRRLNELAGAVDHQLAGEALARLGEDVGRLETEGMEEQAAAEAELEVAKIVEGFSR